MLVAFDQINPSMVNAIISVEDQRFYTNAGVDLKGIARAFVADVIQGKPRQGASTITQQFVKFALERENKRTVFEKLREAALAYHLTRKWSKDKILTEYLNTVYFGNGAYGIEAAARTYFGADHPGCGGRRERPCAKELHPWESALLAGIVQNPSGYDPVEHPQAARSGATSCWPRCATRARSPSPSTASSSRRRCPARTRSARPPSGRRRPPRPTSPPGCASRSSTATAPCGPSRAA